jgi:hypothetical protein
VSLTWSVSNGGRLCRCGHMKCLHEDGESFCIECEMSDDDLMPKQRCKEFRDRTESAAA